MTAMPHLAAIDWDYADRMQHADLGGGDVWFVDDSAGSRVRKVRVNFLSRIIGVHSTGGDAIAARRNLIGLRSGPDYFTLFIHSR